MLQRVHSEIHVLSIFIKLPDVIKIFVLTFFEWSFYTGFTVEYHKVLCVTANISMCVYEDGYGIFQVRLHMLSDSSLIWKKGSFLKKNVHIALIQQTR